jgi:magnesium chelatase subunit I
MIVRETVERIAFEAREDKRVDRRSGVSQRLPISVLEHAISNAERRSLLNHERPVVVRISDIYAALPSITGKLELEYEGELQGGGAIARDLIRRAAGATLAERVDDRAMDSIVAWFDQGGALKMSGEQKTDLCLKGFGVVPELLTLIRQRKLADVNDPGELVAACELVLEGLAAHKRISRNEEGSYGKLRRGDTRP